MDHTELGFFEPFEEDYDDDGSDEEFVMHEDGNWLRWGDGLAGGDSPSWLYPFSDSLSLKCTMCNQALSFLAQFYAPLDDIPHAFHRSLLLFICRNKGCSHVCVLRGQLPKENNYYVSDCTDESEDVQVKFDRSEIPQIELGAAFEKRRIVTEPEPEQGTGKCGLCGIPSTSKCGRCKTVVYCCREHQQQHWKEHKKLCKFLEKELQTATEEEVEDEGEQAEQHGGENADDGQVANTVQEKSDEDFTQEDFDDLVTQGNQKLKEKIKRDPVFDAFQERISRDPSQCIRYCRWPAEDKEDEKDEDEVNSSNSLGPLWISSENQATPESIPACPRCGAPRKFELQVLPQSLHYLNELEMDFGTVCVYTCTKSCAVNDKEYVVEYAHVQQM